MQTSSTSRQTAVKIVPTYSIPDANPPLCIVGDRYLLCDIPSAGGIALWDMQAGHRIDHWLVAPKRQAGRWSRVIDAALTGDGQRVALLYQNGNLAMEQIPKQGTSRMVPLGSKMSGGLCLSPDGHAVACVPENKPIMVYAYPSGRRLFAERWAQAGIFSPDGKSFAAGGIYRLRIWDVSGRRIRREIKAGDSSDIAPFAFAPDGRQFYVMNRYEKPFHHSIDVYDATTLTRVHSFPVVGGDISFGRMGGAALSRDGQWLVAYRQGGDEKQATITLWEANTGNTVAETKAWEMKAIALSASGRWLACSTDERIHLYAIKRQ